MATTAKKKPVAKSVASKAQAQVKKTTDALRKKVDEAIKVIKQLMKQYKLTPADLGFGKAPAKKAAPAKKSGSSEKSGSRQEACC